MRCEQTIIQYVLLSPVQEVNNLGMYMKRRTTLMITILCTTH